jgi:hypothetical protein
MPSKATEFEPQLGVPWLLFDCHERRAYLRCESQRARTGLLGMAEFVFAAVSDSTTSVCNRTTDENSSRWPQCRPVLNRREGIARDASPAVFSLIREYVRGIGAKVCTTLFRSKPSRKSPSFSVLSHWVVVSMSCLLWNVRQINIYLPHTGKAEFQ